MSYCSTGRMLCTALVVLALVIQSEAQTSLQDWVRVQSLARGSEISVKTATGQKYKGALSRATDRELILYAYQRGVFRRDSYRVVIQRNDVVEVRMLARELSGLVGAGIGAGAGAALGAGIDTASARNHEYRGTLAVVFALLGAMVGLAVGRGTGFIKGEKIYVAKPSPHATEKAGATNSDEVKADRPLNPHSPR